MTARFLAAVLLGSFWTASSLAAEAELTISRSDCARLVTRHQPAPDVAYQGGVDVRGRPVAPADLESHSVALPDEIQIYLSIPLNDLLKHYNPRIANSDVYVGTVDYDLKSGRMYFNGQELGDPALNAITDECWKRYR